MLIGFPAHLYVLDLIALTLLDEGYVLQVPHCEDFSIKYIFNIFKIFTSESSSHVHLVCFTDLKYI